jgi:rubrerythrin
LGSKEERMPKTVDNLKAAFAGESQANRRYLAFAKKALEDGRPQVAKLFRAAAAAETIHAHNHLRAMGAIKTTGENLKEAISGEHYEFTKMYPEFLETAKGEDAGQAAWSFNVANKVEEVHHGLYEKALAAVQNGEDLPAAKIWVCEVCGNTVEGTPPEKCPVCGAPRDKFVEIDSGSGADRSVIC